MTDVYTHPNPGKKEFDLSKKNHEDGNECCEYILRKTVFNNKTVIYRKDPTSTHLRYAMTYDRRLLQKLIWLPYIHQYS